MLAAWFYFGRFVGWTEEYVRDLLVASSFDSPVIFAARGLPTFVFTPASALHLRGMLVIFPTLLERLEDEMINNPFDAIPFKEAAWAEGFCKGLAAMASPSPSESISSEDFDAFNDGVATGADAAANGISFDSPCVAALEGSPGHGVGLAIDGAHILHSAWEARHLAGLSAAFAGLLVAVISIGTSAHHSLPADQVLPQLGQGDHREARVIRSGVA